MDVPSPVVGGEVFVGVANQRFAPVTFRLDQAGRKHMAAVHGQRWAAASGLAPGVYRVTPIYRGGHAGRSQSVEVRSGATTVIRFMRQALGALDVEAEPPLCNQAPWVHLTRSSITSSGRAEMEVVRSEMSSTCTLRIEGLEAGDYLVRFVNRTTGALAQSPAHIAPGEVTVARGLATGVRVLGTVTRDGRALVGVVDVVLSLEGQRLDAEVARARVLPGGAFELTVPEPGTYVAKLEVNGMASLGSERPVVLSTGVQRLDWVVHPGTISIDIRGWGRESPVLLTFRRVGDDVTGLVGTGRVIQTHEDLPIAIPGLPPGRFEVSARQQLPSRLELVSGRRTLEISEHDPTVRLTLELRRYEAELEVIGPDGQRVAAATVTLGETDSIRRIEPGLFSLSGSNVDPGAPVMISALGLAPACVSAPDGGRLQVRLHSGVSSRITFTEPPVGLRSVVGRLSWPGLACDLPADRFPAELLSVNERNGAMTFRLGGLPPQVRVSLTVGGSGLPTVATSFTAGEEASLSLKVFRRGP